MHSKRTLVKLTLQLQETAKKTRRQLYTRHIQVFQVVYGTLFVTQRTECQSARQVKEMLWMSCVNLSYVRHHWAAQFPFEVRLSTGDSTASRTDAPVFGDLL